MTRHHRLLGVLLCVFPVLLCTGILLIPYLSSFADHGAAAAAVAHSNRWVWGHVLSGVAFTYGVFAVSLFSISVLPFRKALGCLLFLVPGAGLLAVGMGADGVGPVVFAAAGYPAAAFFDASARWVVTLFVLGSVAFCLGQIVLLVQLQHQAQITNLKAGLLYGAAALFGVSSAIPSSLGLIVLGVTALFIYFTLGVALYRGEVAPGESASRVALSDPVN